MNVVADVTDGNMLTATRRPVSTNSQIITVSSVAVIQRKMMVYVVITPLMFRNRYRHGYSKEDVVTMVVTVSVELVTFQHKPQQEVRGHCMLHV